MIGTALAIGLGTAAAVGTKVVGGVMQSKAANSAAQIQKTAADQAAEDVQQVVKDTNPQVTDAATKAGQDVSAAADKSAEIVNEATTNANALLNPYAATGANAASILDKGITEGGAFNKTPTLADIQIDPGFDFRYGQALKDFERSAAAHGGVDDGGTWRAMEELRQGLRSQEFAAAWDRYQKSTQNRFNNVFSVAGMGKDAAGTQGDRLVNAGRYAGDIGYNAAQYGSDANMNATNLTTGRTIAGVAQGADYKTQGADAQAAGKVAGSNALWNGISGGADAAYGGIVGYNLLKNPYTSGSVSPSSLPIGQLNSPTAYSRRWLPAG